VQTLPSEKVEGGEKEAEEKAVPPVSFSTQFEATAACIGWRRRDQPARSKSSKAQLWTKAKGQIFCFQNEEETNTGAETSRLLIEECQHW